MKDFPFFELNPLQQAGGKTRDANTMLIPG
jgi:hypothetical protein